MATTITWAHGDSPLSLGDYVSISGIYKRRTWWQWLLRRPRQPVNFVVQSICQKQANLERID